MDKVVERWVTTSKPLESRGLWKRFVQERNQVLPQAKPSKSISDKYQDYLKAESYLEPKSQMFVRDEMGFDEGGLATPKRGLVDEPGSYAGKYPPGVRYRPERNKAKPYEVVKDGKAVAKFKTEKQAAEAYKKLKIPKGKIGLSIEEFKTLRLKNKNLTDSEFIREVIKDKYVTEYGGKLNRQAVGLYNESAGISKQLPKAAVPRKVGEIKEVLNRTKEGKQSVKLYNQGKLSLEDLRFKATQAAARKKKAEAGFYRTEEYLAKKREYEQTPKARETRRLRNKAAREAFENKYGVWTSGNNPKDRFWKSLYTSTQGKETSRLQLVKETVPKKFKGANVKDVKFYDTKTGKTFGYNNLQDYIDKNVGKGAYEKVLTPFKEKFLLNETFFDYKGKNVNLNQHLNKTLIPNYNAGNPFHTALQVHHPFGINKNPFVTQLLAYDKNFKEFRPREAVIPDIKKANTFGEKRKVLEDFIKKSDPKVLTAPGKKIYGTDTDTFTKIKDLYKAQDKTLPKQLTNLLSKNFKCGAADGGTCADPRAYIDDINKQRELALKGDKTAQGKFKRVIRGVKAAKSIATGTGLLALGEIGFAPIIGLPMYGAGEEGSRIWDELTYGAFGKSEKEQQIENMGTLGQQTFDLLEKGEALNQAEADEDVFMGPEDSMMYPSILEGHKKRFQEALEPFKNPDETFNQEKFGTGLNLRKAGETQINKFKQQKALERRADPFEESWGAADGGIATLNPRRPHAIPPKSGPMPQGGGLSSMFNRVRKW